MALACRSKPDSRGCRHCRDEAAHPIRGRVPGDLREAPDGHVRRAPRRGDVGLRRGCRDDRPAHDAGRCRRHSRPRRRLVARRHGRRAAAHDGAPLPALACDATLQATLALADTELPTVASTCRAVNGRGCWPPRCGAREIGGSRRCWPWTSTRSGARVPRRGCRTPRRSPRSVADVTARRRSRRRSEGDADTVVVSSGWPWLASPPDASPPVSSCSSTPSPAAVRPALLRTPASLVGGVTAIDRDGDGRSDRLYVADAAWRVWRLDRATGSATSTWLGATPFADLAAMAEPGATLQYAPDVALMGDGDRRRLDVSIGTSNAPGRVALRHWLFVLHDSFDTPGRGCDGPDPPRRSAARR